MMKRIKSLTFLNAIALIGFVGLTACSSDEDVIENPNYDPETNTVKTQFAISIPVAGEQQTRMDVTDVQGQSSPVFIGMQDVSLVAYSDMLPDDGTLGSITATKIELSSTEIPAGGFTASPLAEEKDGTTNHSKLYSDVVIPIGTKSFMFYAQSKASRSSSDDYFKSGVLTTPESFTANPATFKFSLNSTQAEDPTANSVGVAIVNYLTSIIQTTDWSSMTETSTLGQLYAKFKLMRAGSSATALAAVQQLYDDLADYTSLTASNIKNNILQKATDSGNGILSFSYDLKNYPGNINLPDGAALITFNEDTQSFSVADVSTYSTLNVGASANYVYPASLYYRANSAIKTSTELEVDNYTTANSWEGILKNYTEGTIVTKNTHSVAIQDPIQYAVGRLDLRIKAGAAKLKDRYGKEVELKEGGFPVTAILIGNQKAVGYDFKPLEDESEKTIYDKAVLPEMKAGADDYSVTNYTLALETEENKHVHVIVELINNSGNSFQGADGVIPAGGKFYLIAELNPETTSLNAQYQDNTGNKVFAQDYVTIVDLIIDTNSAASENDPQKKGLGGAYNIIPDSRETSFELGMSVNLQWKAGITFTSII